MMKDYNFLFKLLIIGDSHVGKSNLLLRFTESTFHSSFQPTIGVDFKIKSLVVDDTPIKLQLWDTAGQERFRNITNSYYKGAHGIVIVYDITNHVTFNSVESWLEEAEKHGAKGLAKILVGNKTDLPELRQVSTEEGARKAKQNDMAFMETSAKEGDGVEEAFLWIVKEVKERMEKCGGGKESQIGGGVKVGMKLDTDKIVKTKKNCDC